jgi:hypothetical protein
MSWERRYKMGQKRGSQGIKVGIEDEEATDSG